MCEITLLVSLVVLVLFGADIFVLEGGTSTILVPPLAAMFAAITALVSIVAYARAPQKYLYTLAAITYGLLTTTIGLLISLTGSSNSPYIAVWMLIMVFSGLFGTVGIISIFLASNTGLVFNLIGQKHVSLDELLISILAVEIPILISYLIWHNRTAQEERRDQAVTNLEKQLTTVTSNSETIVNSIADGVIAMDARGVIQLMNPAAQTITGWKRPDAVGLDYHSVLKLSDYRGKDIPDERSPIQQVIKTGKPLVNNDLSLTTASGKQILLSLVVSPIGTATPTNGAIAVFRDVTNEKEEERQKAEFISTASHEMRTPVAAIEGYLGLALNPATSYIDDKARAYLAKAHEATQHLGRLFQDLLTVSRADEGRMPSKPAIIDLTAFLKEVVEGLQPKAEAKKLFLQFKPAAPVDTEKGNRNIPPLYYCFTDPDQLREITNNLIDNAIKYTKQGSVTVDIAGDDKHVVISIADTGIGIPAEDASHLFQKFYRIDNSDTREIGGTGLGLYISRRLTESNGGRIWVESAYGKGSTFFVQLPRISSEKAQGLIDGTLSPEQAQVV